MKSPGEIEESFHAGQTRILEMVASNAPLPEVLESIVLLMEAQAEGMLCSILLLDVDGIHIRHGAAPGLPNEYIKKVDGAPIGPRHGSCGTAMFLRKAVVVTDVLIDPLSAILAERPVIFGVAQMYEHLMDGAMIEVRAFRTRNPAAQWLEVPVKALSCPT